VNQNNLDEEFALQYLDEDMVITLVEDDLKTENLIIEAELVSEETVDDSIHNEEQLRDDSDNCWMTVPGV